MLHGKPIGLLSDLMLRREARSVYRKLLRQVKPFTNKHDPILGSYIHWRSTSVFRSNVHVTSVKLRRQQIKEGIKSLRVLKKADRGNSKAMEKLIAYSYGKRGLIKNLLERFNRPPSKKRRQAEIVPFFLYPMINYSKLHDTSSNRPLPLFEFSQQQLTNVTGHAVPRRQRRMYERALQSTKQKFVVNETIDSSIDGFFGNNQKPADFTETQVESPLQEIAERDTIRREKSLARLDAKVAAQAALIGKIGKIKEELSKEKLLLPNK